MKHDEFEQELKILWETLMFSHMARSTWAALRERENQERWKPFSQEFPSLYGTITQALLTSIVTSLGILFSEGNREISLLRTLNRGEKSGLLPVGSVNEAESVMRLKGSQTAARKIKTLRNKLFAHRAVGKTVEDIFEEAAITPAAFIILIITGHEVLNLMSNAFDGSAYPLDIDPREEAVRLLDTIRQAQSA